MCASDHYLHPTGGQPFAWFWSTSSSHNGGRPKVFTIQKGLTSAKRSSSDIRYGCAPVSACQKGAGKVANSYKG